MLRTADEAPSGPRRRALPRRWAAIAIALALTLAAVLAPWPTRAGELFPSPLPPTPAASSEAAAEKVAPDSPRASMQHYLDLCRGGQYADAARYLDVPPRADGAKLAQRLKAVLDRHLWLDADELSPLPLGDSQDNLAPGIEEVGKIPAPSGPEPVRIVRRATADGVRWVFTRTTVDRVEAWYGRLGDRWLRDHLPPALLRSGPRELLWWQWLALPGLSLLGWAFGRTLSYGTRIALRRLARRTTSTLDDKIVDGTRGSLTFAFMMLAVDACLPWLGLYPPAEAFIEKLLRAGLFLAFFWLVLGTIDVVREHLLGAPTTRDNPAARSLVPLVGRIAKVSVLVMAVIAVLSELGYPVASLIAGLGIGGVAVALAAQKTVENLFGSVAIGIDQPFRVGDFVKVDAVLGTVEAIGLRSTRIRTLDRTLITLPNGKLADLQIESFAARDRIRLACVLGLVYGTTAAQVREIVDGCERALREHPRIWPDEVVVRFVGFGQSSLDVEIAAWFQLADFNEFRDIRQEMLLSFMEIVQAAGSNFAFPTRTLHIAASSAAGEARPEPGAA